jgi:hypothetical protein
MLDFIGIIVTTALMIVAVTAIITHLPVSPSSKLTLATPIGLWIGLAAAAAEWIAISQPFPLIGPFLAAPLAGAAVAAAWPMREPPCWLAAADLHGVSGIGGDAGTAVVVRADRAGSLLAHPARHHLDAASSPARRDDSDRLRRRVVGVEPVQALGDAHLLPVPHDRGGDLVRVG